MVLYVQYCTSSFIGERIAVAPSEGPTQPSRARERSMARGEVERLVDRRRVVGCWIVVPPDTVARGGSQERERARVVGLAPRAPVGVGAGRRGLARQRSRGSTLAGC